ncbi:MAG: RnfABCDGE type electron transport complex subunit G [Lachnospiraceae bacterium]|nr:RnfABCDGE type electron transport complex subunit G [Lachnospiraceae bacterium]
MKEIILNTLKLCLITLIAGVLLGGVYEITKKPRAIQEEKSKNEAYSKVFNKADSFKNYKYDKEKLKSYLKENGYNEKTVYVNDAVLAVDKNGETLGYVITITDKEGYGGDVSFTIGINNDGTINGISFLTLQETAGVGMKADLKFKDQFKGMKAEKIEYIKSGKKNENQIDAISGATITTNAVTNGVNCGVCSFKYFKEGGNQNE